MRSLLLGAALVASAQLALAAEPRASAQRVEAGRRVYQARCAQCHGARAEGQPAWDHPNAAGEMPAPAHDRTGHTWKHSDAMLYRIVADGWRDPFNKTQRLTMPAFGATLSPQEIREVIEYLKTLWTPRQRAFQKQESRNAPYPASLERK